jgi:hypothetical protein
MAYKTSLFFFVIFLLVSLEGYTTPFKRQHTLDLSLNPTPYILPKNHHLKRTLDSIFAKGIVLENEKTFSQAGFKTICLKSSSGIRLAQHPLVKGYLFKVYLDSDTHHRGMGSWSKQDCLIQRCIGAQKIRTLIETLNFRYFTVPDKWLYKVSSIQKNPSFILVVTHMPIFNVKESKKAWKTKVTKGHLEELFTIMKNGCASGGLALNVPYTKTGKFAFIDTEYPERVFDLPQEKKFFSLEMQAYWDFLLQNQKELKYEQKNSLSKSFADYSMGCSG